MLKLEIFGRSEWMGDFLKKSVLTPLYDSLPKLSRIIENKYYMVRIVVRPGREFNLKCILISGLSLNSMKEAA